MTTHLYLAPAGHGKTQHVLQRIRAVQIESPLAPIYAIFPNQNQVHAFRDRLSMDQGVLNVTLGTFYTFYPQILGLAGRLQPSIPEPLQYRLLRQAVETLTDRGDLIHFADLRDKPGFVVILRALVEEFKRASIGRPEFVQAVAELPHQEPRLTELTAIYTYYQDWLLDNGWADTEGQGWLAALSLQRDKKLCSNVRLLVVDGFDEFTPNQMEVLKLLTERADETVVTLTGDVRPPPRLPPPRLPLKGEELLSSQTEREEVDGAVLRENQVVFRPAWRRFRRALGHIQRTLEVEPEQLPEAEAVFSQAEGNADNFGTPLGAVSGLRFLEENLFQGELPDEAGALADNDNAVELIEAQNRAEEARAALRWAKARLVQDGMAPHEVALIGRDIGPYRLFLEETAAEFGLPIHVGEGMRLITNPAIAALMSLLSLPLESNQGEGNWARRHVFDVLRNPYLQDVAPDIRGRDVLRLEGVARKARVVRGLDQWQEALADWVAYVTRRAEEAAAKEAKARESGAEALQERSDDVDEGNTNQQVTPEEAERLQGAFVRFARRVVPLPIASIRHYAAFIEFFIGEEPSQKAASQTTSNGSIEIVGDASAAGARATDDEPPSGIAVRAALAHETSKRDLAALRAFKDILRSVVLASDSLEAGPEKEDSKDVRNHLTYAEFLQDLNGSVQGATYYPPTADSMNSAVPILSVLNSRGLSFRAVAIIGLAEGDFPRGEREDILLREEDRERLRDAGLTNLETRLHGDEISFFYQAVTRATERLLLTRPYLSEGGEAWEPSPYWEEVERLLKPNITHIRPEDPLPANAAASQAEWMWLLSRQNGQQELSDAELAILSAAEIERVLRNSAILRARLEEQPAGPFDGDLTALSPDLTSRYSPDHVWSSSRLEAYGLCPLHFWLGQDLALEERQPPQEGFDVFILGNMYHEILEEIYNQVDGPADAESLLALLPEIAATVFDEAPQTYGFRPSPLWSMQRFELEQIMARTIAALAEATAELTPMAQEQIFGLEGAPPLAVVLDGDEFRVRGFIDRIDRDADGNLHIIDYKSGSAAIRAVDLEEGRRLQIALYALAAQDALGLGKINDGFYWHVGAAKASSLKLSKFEGGAQAALDQVVDHTFAHVRGVRAGQFKPTPPSSGCPSHCPGASFCWRYKAKAF